MPQALCATAACRHGHTVPAVSHVSLCAHVCAVPRWAALRRALTSINDRTMLWNHPAMFAINRHVAHYMRAPAVIWGGLVRPLEVPQRSIRRPMGRDRDGRLRLSSRR